MNAFSPIPETVTTAPTDAQLIAFDGLVDLAGVLNGQALALLAASMACDPAATEAALWGARRVLTMAISTWREVTPALQIEEGGR